MSDETYLEGVGPLTDAQREYLLQIPVLPEHHAVLDSISRQLEQHPDRPAFASTPDGSFQMLSTSFSRRDWLIGDWVIS